VSIVEDYYWFQKFNVMELANARNEPERFEKGAGRKIRSKMIMIMELHRRLLQRHSITQDTYLCNEAV
jgi:hypothetical protein